MKKWAYYNEIDPNAAAWIRELIKAGHVADGEVDERSIELVSGYDVRDFTQCHWFAGIAGWSLALRLAGWPDDRPVWTGSCPCQPFSAAGKRKGTADERHLWPAFYERIRACKPPIIFGEQVASSVVTGRYRGDGMQSVWQTWQLLSLCKDGLEGVDPEYLQGLPQLGRSPLERLEAGQHREQGESAGCFGKEARRGTADAVRLGGGLAGREAGARILRDERKAVRSYGEARLLDTVAGQERSEGRLPHGEHQGDPLRAECGAWELGRGEAVRDSDEGHRDTIEALDDLISEISGEIEGEDGSSWVSAVQLDLERSGYTFGACAAPACSLGAPHIRQRLWFVGKRMGDDDDARREGHGLSPLFGGWDRGGPELRAAGPGAVGDMGDTLGARLEGHAGHGDGAGGRTLAARPVAEAGEPRGMADSNEGRRGQQQAERQAQGGGQGGHADLRRGDGGMADADGRDAGAERQQRSGEQRQQPEDGGAGGMADAISDDGRGQHGGCLDRTPEENAGEAGERQWLRAGPADGGATDGSSRPGPVNGHWRAADWLYCRDGKWRPVEPGTFPLVDGVSEKLVRSRDPGAPINADKTAEARVMRLRGYGNAIVPEVAATFIQAVM